MIGRLLGKVGHAIANRRKEKRVNQRIAELTGSDRDYTPGSPEWLSLCELEMGGIVQQVERKRVSDLDPRSAEELQVGGMTGGDRMIHHDYSEIYARHLAPWVGRGEDLVVLEAGILKGTGLAVWSKLFPDATLIGLDIDLRYTQDNMAALKARGAFAKGDPILLEFDQFAPDTAELERHLAGRTIDIVIDDGFHSDETIINTFNALKPLLSKEFVFFAEDNDTVSGALANGNPELAVLPHGELTVVIPKQ